MHWLIIGYTILIFAVSRQRSLDTSAVIDASATYQIAYTFLVIFCLLIKFISSRAIQKSLHENRSILWILTYFILGLLSVIWSSSPELTGFRAIQSLVFLILVWVAIYELNGYQVRIKFALLFSLIYITLFHLIPAFQIGNYIWHNSTVPGTIIGVIFLGVLVKDKLWKLVWLFCVITGMAATSTTSFVSTIFGVIIYFVFSRLQGKILFIVATLFIAIAFYIIQFNPFDWVMGLKTERQIFTITGRIPVWEWVIEEKISRQPILGFGFAIGDTLGRGAPTLAMYHMHNTFLAALANLGIVGLFLLLMSYFVMMNDGWLHTTGNVRAMCMAAGLAMIMNSLTIPSISSALSFPWIGHMLVFAIISMGNRRKSSKVHNKSVIRQ